MKQQDQWFYKEYENREAQVCHRAYEEELYFFQAVKEGDVDYIHKVCSVEHFAEIPGVGILSKQELRNAQYHYVISVALTTRACVEGGLPIEEAFSLSDFYIQQVEKCHTPLEVDTLNYQMSIDFTKRVQMLIRNNIYSKPISKCISYIYSHLHSKVKIDELAELVKLNKSYLSKLFKSETGYTIQGYITMQKIQEAQNMLRYSEFTCNEVAHNLAFASQSHFTDTFKSYTGMTPKTYRELYYGKTLSIAENLSKPRISHAFEKYK